MLVLGECGRVLAAVPLLGHLPATAILDSCAAGAELLPALASGERRAAYLPARPPDDMHGEWSVDPAGGMERAPVPIAARGADGEARVTGQLAFVPDAPGADVLVGVALLDGKPVGFAVQAAAAGVNVDPVRRYDATRALGPRRAEGRARPAILDASEETLAARLAPRPGADRRRVARRRRDRPGDLRRLRQGALHLRPRDRLLPGRQALPHRGPAPARERPLAALLRRLVAPRRARRVPARRRRRCARSPGARSTPPRAR